MEKLHNKHIIEIVIAIGGAIVLGWLIKKIVFPILYKFTNKTKWKKGLKNTYSVAEIRNNQPNAYKPWSKDEDYELIRLEKEGKSVKELVFIFVRKKCNFNKPQPPSTLFPNISNNQPRSVNNCTPSTFSLSASICSGLRRMS